MKTETINLMKLTPDSRPTVAQQSFIVGRSTVERPLNDICRSAEVQKCKCALLHFCTINHPLWRFAAMLLMLITMSVGQVWGWTISTNGRAYYDDTKSNWSAKGKTIVIFPEKSDGSQSFAMDRIEGTKLYTWSGNWGDGAVSTLRFACTQSAWGWEGNSSWNRLNNNSNCYGMSGTWGIDLNSGVTLFVSGGSGSNTSASNLSSATNYSDYKSLNKKQTVKVMVSTDNGGSYHEAGQYYGTIKASRYALSNATTANNSEKTLSNGDSYASGVLTSSITFTASATIDGYTFMGWGESSTATPDGQASKTYTVSDTKTIYAFYKQNFYSVNYGLVTGCDGMGTFEARQNGDSWATATPVANGSSLPHGTYIRFEVTSTTAGYEYLGIYSDKAGNSRFVAPAYSGTSWPMKEPANAYAKFQPKTYAITLDDDDDHHHNGSATATFGGGISNLIAPTREGYTPNGYYNYEAKKVLNTDGTLVASIEGWTDANGNWKLADNHTLYAHYDENMHTVSVAYKCDETVIKEATTSGSAGISTKVAITAPAIAGYTFSSWSELPVGVTTSDALTNQTINVNITADSKTIQANYTHNATFDLVVNAGAHITSVSGGKSGQTSVPFNSDITATAATGYDFLSWTASPAENAAFADANSANTAVTVSNSSVTVTANAQVHNYSITYDGLEGATHSNPASYTIESADITLTAPSARTGFYFLGWFDGSDNQVTSITNGSTGDIVLTAHWETCIQVNFGVIGRCESQGDVTVTASSVSISSGDYVRPNTPLHIAAEAATGYKFIKWHGQADGNDSGFHEGQPTIEYNVTETANWFAEFGERTYGITIDNADLQNWSTFPLTKKNNTWVMTRDFAHSGDQAYTFAISSDWDRFDAKKLLITNVTLDPSCEGIVSKKEQTTTDFLITLPDGAHHVVLTYTPTTNSTGTLSIVKVANVFLNSKVASPEGTSDGTPKWGREGIMLNWNEAMTEASVTVNLKSPIADYAFQLYTNNSNYNKGIATINRSSNSTTLEKANSTSSTVHTDVTGDYVFTYNVNENKITVTYPTAYTVTFSQGTTKGGGQNAVTTSNGIATGDLVLSGTEITFTRPEAITGYNFAGWFDNLAGTGVALGTEATYTTTITANTNVYAVYAPVNYSITYNTNGGDAMEAGNYNITTATFDLPAASRSGYWFQGWYENEDLEGVAVTQIAKGSTGDKIFYAKWKECGYYLNINTTGGTWAQIKFAQNGEEYTITDHALSAGSHKYSIRWIQESGESWLNASSATSWDDRTRTIKLDSESGFESNQRINALFDGNYSFRIFTGSDSQKKLETTYPASFAVTKGEHLTVSPALVEGRQLAGATLTFTAEAAATGYTFDGFYSDAQFEHQLQNGSNLTYTIASLNADASVYAKYHENLYTVTVSHTGEGTVSSEGEQQVGVVGLNLTATPASHYYLNDWTVDGGAAMDGNHLTATAAGTATANFTPSWSVRGNYNPNWEIANYIEHYEGNTGYVDIELSVGTYQFKVFHHGEANAYGNNGEMTRNNCSGWTMATDKDNCRITTDKAGVYRFTFDVNTKRLTVTYPATYKIYIGYNGVSQGDFAYNNGCSIDLQAGKEYEVKVVDATDSEHLIWYGNSGTMTQTNCTDWTFSSSVDDNAGLATTIAGTYNFYFDVVTKKLSVTYPEDAKTPANLSANAVPAQNGDVILQAYYWAHEGNTATKWQKYGSVQWADLNREAAELGDNFDLVWLAPSQATADFTGFIPTNYSVQGNDWGTEAELKTLIASLHAKNVEVIADVVLNHSNPAYPDEYTGAEPNWCSWQTQNFSEYGSFNPTWEWLAKGDEMFYAKKALMGECGTHDNTNNKEDEFGFFANDNQYWWSEPEFNCTYARDWAHNNRNVREMSRAYLTWLRNEIGYDGFRYDFMKGFHGSHVLDYNRAAGATFAVSELFEGDAAKLKGYIETTSRQSYVFDFPAKYQIMNEGIRYGLYNKLLGANNTTLSRDNTYKKYAVTFVDNHDSFHEGSNLCGSANEMPNTGNQVLQANAYILSMPGVPCVFYPHWHEYKDAIRMMIHARKAAGINSESSVIDENVFNDGKSYYGKIEGTNGWVILKLGQDAQTAPGGYITAYSAANVGMYYQTTNADLVTPIVTTPTPSQEYFNQIDVNLSAMGATGASYTIYYTTDGTTPTTSSTTYTAAIPVTADNAIVKAIAVKSDNQDVKSEVLTLNYTKVADKLTLDVTGTLKVGNAATLAVSKLSPEGTKYTYTYQVQEPGSTGFKIVAIDDEMSHNYTLAGGGWYTFRVQTTDNGGNTFSAEKRVQVESETYYLRHPFDNGTNWENVAMQDNGDGTYMYLSDGASVFAGGDKALAATGLASKFYAASGAHVGTDPNKFNQNPENQYTWWAATGAAGEHKKIVDERSDKTDGKYVVWIYNAINDELKVYTPSDKIYRIQVKIGDKTYGSNIIYATGEATEVSFYAATDASYEIQYMGAGVGQWTYLAAISKPDAITENGVYSGTVTITDQEEEDHVITTAATAEFSNISKYTGEYQVTSLATTKLANTMTKFNNSETYYDHYYVEWVDAADDNVKNTYATVGNSINANLANAIGNYTIKTGANVRYAYNPATNVFTRTHMAGSISNEKFVSAFGQNLTSAHNSGTELAPRYAELTNPTDGETFLDGSDWVYKVDLRSSGNGVETSLKLASQYNGAYTYLLTADGLDADDAKKVLAEEHNKLGNKPQFTAIYDYKTNKIIFGWNPVAQTINQNVTVPNLIISRIDDGATSEFEIGNGQVIVSEQMISELIITKQMFLDWGGGTDGGYKTMLFWVSLPYMCKVGDIYGFAGKYSQSTGTSWELQTYRGDLRDKGTPGNHWRAMNVKSLMSANTGYVLAVRLKSEDFKTVKKNGEDVSEVRFFFPSAGSVTLSSTASAKLTAYNTNASTIQRDWHVMGVPVMKSGRKMVATGQDAAPFEFVYRWTWANGDRWYEPIKIKENDDYFNFLSGHAYMVQGHGDLTWNYEQAGEGQPYSAPQRANALTAKDIRIDLSLDGEQQDKTYVLYRSNGKREYEIGRDLEKIQNAGRSMLYSELDQQLASICLSDTDLVQIPLTVVAAEAGEYTLSLSYELNGVEPVLYDKERGLTTLLNHEDYTIDLSQGTYKDRFFLGIQLAPATPTDIQTAEGAASDQAYKFIDERGQLRILRRGHLYDAQGHSLR